MRLAVASLALLLAGCGGSDRAGDGRERHGGLTLEEAKVEAQQGAACPGRPRPKVTRCEPRGDAWRCLIAGDGKTSGEGYVTVEKTEPGAETARLC